MSIEVKNLKSAKGLLEKRIKSDGENSKKKIEQLTKERDDLEQREAEKSVILKEVQAEFETVRENFKKTFEEVKNEKFERKNLDLRYKQSLQVVESDSGHITELNRTISEATNRAEDAERKVKKSEYLLEERTKHFNKEKEKYETKILELKEFL